MIVHLHLEVRDRPALKELVAAMARLSRRQRVEIARMGRRARAAKQPRLRRLTSEANTEAKRLADGEGGRMSNVVQFRRQTSRGVRIVAERFVHFRYTVFPDENLPLVALQTFCLDDACATADDLGKTIIEIGPPEAFGRGSAG